ncbi:MAG TPA: hypothetical protein VD710_02125 [Nitrososphaeraceae archaeon]|nr:hypothetical protein [Nitrososphaeraceae archaeon]
MNRDKNLMTYGFVSVLLLASFLMTVPAIQYRTIFAQTEGEAPDVNVTEEIIENATDTEIPPFESENATFVPRSESEREAPPVPPDAIKGDELPDEMPVKDPDSQPLSVSNRTELLEILPANSTKIIEHVNEDLKNSTGEGLLPPAILDKILSGEGQGNDTILDISTPEELDEIKNFSDVTTNQTTEEAMEEGEPISISNVTNATAPDELPDEGMMNATNATDTETSSEEQDGEEEQAQAGAETNMTNATGGESPAEEREEQEQAQTAEETQAGEAVNITNATGGESPAEEREEQEQAEQEEEQEQTQASVEQQQEDTEDGEEQEQAVTNATVREGILNATNVTSMLNATGLEDQAEDSEDSPEDESEDE